jgi:hypothetical protein
MMNSKSCSPAASKPETGPPFKHHMLPVGPLNQAVPPLSTGSSLSQSLPSPVFGSVLPMAGTLSAPIWDVDPSWANWQWSSATGRSHSGANRFLCHSNSWAFQFSGISNPRHRCCAHLAKLHKSAIYIHRVSAERIGLGRESGLADDLLQNPISNRQRSRAATRIPVQGRQRTWPQEL